MTVSHPSQMIRGIMRAVSSSSSTAVRRGLMIMFSTFKLSFISVNAMMSSSSDVTVIWSPSASRNNNKLMQTTKNH